MFPIGSNDICVKGGPYWPIRTIQRLWVKKLPFFFDGPMIENGRGHYCVSSSSEEKSELPDSNSCCRTDNGDRSGFFLSLLYFFYFEFRLAVKIAINYARMWPL